MLWGCVPCSGAPYTAPRALHCSRGSIHCSKGSALLWGSVQCTRGSVHSSKGYVHCSGALYNTLRALCVALELCTPLPGPLHIVISKFLLRTAGAAEAAALSCPAARCPQHHCHVAASISISTTATHCLCLRTHQHQPGPSRPSTDGLLLLRRLAGPWGPLVTRVGDTQGRCCPPSPAAGAGLCPCLPRRSRVQHCHGQSPAVHRSFWGGF